MTTTLAIPKHVADYRAGKVSGLELSGTFDVLADWLADPEYGGMGEWIGGRVVAEWDKQLGDWMAVPGPDRRAEYASTPWTCPPHLARLVAWRLRMEDEAWHGVEECKVCKGTKSISGPRDACALLCRNCKDGLAPTFALLFDREEVCPACMGSAIVDGLSCANCSDDREDGIEGNRTIPGHLSELIAWLRVSGDAKADEIAGLSIRESSYKQIREAGVTHIVLTDGVPLTGEGSYPDACRELIRRVGEVLCEECVCRSTRPGHCVKCHGLGFVGRVEERAVRVS